MTSRTSPPVSDRHLGALENAMLLASASAVILVFYLFVIVSVLCLVIVLGVEIVILAVLARFGLLGVIIPLIARHGAVLAIFLRSLRLRKSGGFRLPLKAADVPELSAVLKKICSQAKVPLPRKVYLEMGVNAWVDMRGYRPGAGTTILGIGYDLLAGLSRTEMEGVLAHEMMHAKLVQRGFRQLLVGGIRRAGQLSNGLVAQLQAARRAKQSATLLGAFTQGADFLTRTAVRQVAACSRQDEFAADRGAAELCGAGAICSSLRKLEGLNRIAARLPWRDRIAQLESGEGFSLWLVRELAAAPAYDDTKEYAFNAYSTHPSLRDRLTALAKFPDQTVADSPPAIDLLAHPDEVAAKLVAAIQNDLIKKEAADSKQLDRWSRKLGGRTNMQPLQVLGFFIALAAVVGMFIAWNIPGMSLGLALLSLVGIVLGITLAKTCGYREKHRLPIPDYAIIKSASLKKVLIKEEEPKIEAELRASAHGVKAGKQRAEHHLRQSFEALEKCDYLRAHVAARISLEHAKKSVPAKLAYAVAAGGMKLNQQLSQALQFVRQYTGMKGATTAWGSGWSLLLAGDWAHAEALLDLARIRNPKTPTILALLAISQSRRGKLFSALANARKAVALKPGDKEYAKLLIDLLLQAGLLREASALTQPLGNLAMTDLELTMTMIKLSLLLRDEATAEQWIEVVRQSPEGAKKFVTLGEVFAATRRDEKAAEHFQTALSAGHYPEALLGLGVLEANRQNKSEAERYLTAALDLLRPLGEDSSGAVPLVVPVLNQLKLLREPVANCRAWIASMPAITAPPALANTSFLIYERDEAAARTSLETALNAMRPGAPALSAIHWRPAPREQQPGVPVHPGIQGVLT